MDTAAAKKRKPSASLDNSAKKPRPLVSAPHPHDSPLYAPHAAVVHDLSGKYDVLPASIISSTPIRKRLVHITSHLLGPSTVPAEQQTATDDGRRRVVLLYARPAEVCKMITVAEKCKRLLEEQRRSMGDEAEVVWFQYNQMFDLPRDEAERTRTSTEKKKKKKKKKRVVEETMLIVEEDEDDDGEEDDTGSEGDAFETMRSRFEKAVLPPAPARTTKSLRIFLSTVAIPELKTKDGVTVQSHGTK